MLNSEKFKTCAARTKAFSAYCDVTKLTKQCEDALSCTECQFAWLGREADEDKPLPCPFCRGETWVRDFVPANGRAYDILCRGCEYRSQRFYIKEHAIAAHNRVARAVMEAGKKDEK